VPALDRLFRLLKERGGSDLHLETGLAPRIRLHGHLESIDNAPVLEPAALAELLRELVTPVQWAAFQKDHDLDFAYGLEGVARFRANYLYDQSGMAAVFRIIPSDIIPLAKLGLPPAIERFVHLAQGLVLVTGPTGSGKSSTLAAIIDLINSSYAKHIVTIEDPIEFVHRPKRSVITQREVGAHTESFANALRSAVRLDPDVILVGEMRDLETIHLAMTSAEMGVLVFGTLHTNSARKTIDRIIDAFPSDQQNQARTMLSESLAGVASQLLLRRRDGQGRVVASELLLRTSGLANIIREGNIPMLASVIESGRGDGMQSLDESLMEHVKSGAIAPEDAFLKANDKTRFATLLRAGGAVKATS